jgi:pimeloyl-ACP methyl ester carboxylesterase
VPSFIDPLEPRRLLAALTLDGSSTFATAANLGRVAGAITLENALTPGESSDFYAFTVRAKGNVNLTLTHLAANANLRLFDPAGKTLASSARTRARSESIGRNLNPGTYVFAVDRGKRAADTGFTLTLRADLNTGAISIDGRSYALSLNRSDGTPAPINSARETWVGIHGWQSTPQTVHRLAVAIDAASRHNQVLELDWSTVAADPNIVAAALNVDTVAAWAARQLSAWNIPGHKINLIGHSLGGYMTDEVARRIPGGVDRIVALDPAAPDLGGIDFANTQFAADSRASVAFVGSQYSSMTAAKTADETVRLNVGPWSSFAAHANVRELFTLMTERNNTPSADRVSRVFSLTAIARSPGRRFADNGAGNGFDATLTARQSDSRYLPDTFTYKSPRLGKTQTVHA